MTAGRNRTPGEQNSAAHPAQRTVAAKQLSQKILAVVDGSERTGRVLEYLIWLSQCATPIEVVVLNVQPAPEGRRLRGYVSFKQDEIFDRLVNDLGKPIVTRVGRTLDQIGIDHKERIELGEPTATILRCANEESCELIVLGESRPGAFRQWLVRIVGLTFDSVATNVVQLAEMPVVVVK